MYSIIEIFLSLFFHGILYQSKDKKISMIEYNDRTVYDWVNNLFSVDCCISALNPPPITIDKSYRLNQKDWYTFDTLLSAISFTSRKSVCTLTTSKYPPKLLEPNSYDPDTLHTIMSDKLCRVRTRRGFWSRFHYGENEKPRFYF